MLVQALVLHCIDFAIMFLASAWDHNARECKDLSLFYIPWCHDKWRCTANSMQYKLLLYCEPAFNKSIIVLNQHLTWWRYGFPLGNQHPRAREIVLLSLSDVLAYFVQKWQASFICVELIGDRSRATSINVTPVWRYDVFQRGGVIEGGRTLYRCNTLTKGHVAICGNLV